LLELPKTLTGLYPKNEHDECYTTEFYNDYYFFTEIGLRSVPIEEADYIVIPYYLVCLQATRAIGNPYLHLLLSAIEIFVEEKVSK
jgi:hypothetical protein